VIADHGGKVGAFPRQLQNRLTAHAIADRRQRQALGSWEGAQRFKRGEQPGAVMIHIAAQRFGQRTRGFEVGNRLAVEIGDQRQIALLGQHGRAPLGRGLDVGDGRKHQHRRTGRANRAGQPPGQRGAAIAVFDPFERAHSGRKSGTER